MFSKNSSNSNSVNSIGDYFVDSSSEDEYSSEFNVQEIAAELIFHEMSKNLSQIEHALLKLIILTFIKLAIISFIYFYLI